MPRLNFFGHIIGEVNFYWRFIMEVLYQNLLAVEFNQVIMWAIGGVLILALVRGMIGG